MFRNTVVGVVAIVVLVLGLLAYCQVVAPQKALSEASQPQSQPQAVPVQTPVVTPSSPEQTAVAPVIFVEYVVKKGDTLSEISEQHHQNWRKFTEIAQDSGIKNPDLIYPGDKLRIRQN